MKSLFNSLSAAAFVVLGLASVFYATNAQATLRITKTYAFPISKYEQVEAAVAEAAARSPQDMKSVFRKNLDAGDRSSIMCIAGSPTLPVITESGFGCTLNFAADLGNGFTMETSQMLNLRKSSADLKKALADANPNNQSTLELGSFFDGGDGSSYTCTAIGAAGAKTWDCNLKMISAAR